MSETSWLVKKVDEITTTIDNYIADEVEVIWDAIFFDF